MTARSKARKRALDILFEADLKQADQLTVLSEHQARFEGAGAALNPYAGQLVRGVHEHQAEIDELLATYSLGWSLARMPAVDRSILRIGAYELLYTDAPPGAVISEAVALSASLSTDDSPGFVNGLLARLADLRTRMPAPRE